MFYVYILKCNDDRFYVGGTTDLKRRLQRHNSGYIPATKDRRPMELVAYFAFSNKHMAFNFEKYLKTGSGRAFMRKRLV